MGSRLGNEQKQQFPSGSVDRNANNINGKPDTSKNRDYEQTEHPHQIDMERKKINPEDEQRERQVKDLNKSLNQHAVLIEGLDAQLNSQNILLQYFAENTANSTDDTHEKINKPENVDGFVDILLNIQKSCESISRPLKDSFEKLCINLDRFREDQIQQQKKLKDELKQLKDSASKHELEAAIKGEKKRSRSRKETSSPKMPPVTLQLFYLHGGNLIKEIENELKSMLCSKLGNINFLHRKQASDIDPNRLVVVLNIVASRVGADAANAIKDIQNLGNAILLLIHYKDAHSLPRERSSEVLIDEQFRHLRAILDLAFKSGDGFYHCEMNTSGGNFLCSFCKNVDGERL